MNVGPTLPLRTFARRLPRVQNVEAKIDTDALLSLLKSGDLTAGFHFPGRVSRWVPIPIGYWATIGADDFRKVQYEQNNKQKPGTFKVRVTEFSHEFAQAVSADFDSNKNNQGSETRPTALLEELQQALAVASVPYEVVIPVGVWAKYLERHNLVERPAAKPKAGRSEKPSWRRLAVIIAAYLVKHGKTTKEEFKIEEVAKKIHAIAKDEGLPGLVDWTTIKGTLTEIRQSVETISID